MKCVAAPRAPGVVVDAVDRRQPGGRRLAGDPPTTAASISGCQRGWDVPSTSSSYGWVQAERTKDVYDLDAPIVQRPHQLTSEPVLIRNELAQSRMAMSVILNARPERRSPFMGAEDDQEADSDCPALFGHSQERRLHDLEAKRVRGSRSSSTHRRYRGVRIVRHSGPSSGDAYSRWLGVRAAAAVAKWRDSNGVDAGGPAGGTSQPSRTYRAGCLQPARRGSLMAPASHPPPLLSTKNAMRSCLSCRCRSRASAVALRPGATPSRSSGWRAPRG